MFGLLTGKLVVQGVDRFLQELHLNLVLLNDVAVFLNHLLVVVFNIAFQFSQNAHLKLFVVIDRLSDPVDRVFELTNVTVVFADVRIS